MLLRLVNQPQIIDIGDDFKQDGFLAANLSNFKFQQTNIFQPLVVLRLSLVQRRLLNLDFLVQQSQFTISADQLSSENVSLTDNLVLA